MSEPPAPGAEDPLGIAGPGGPLLLRACGSLCAGRMTGGASAGKHGKKTADGQRKEMPKETLAEGMGQVELSEQLFALPVRMTTAELVDFVQILDQFH